MTTNYEIDDPVREEIRKTQRPLGGFPGMPELLDRRRIEYAIPDSAFAKQAVYDRLFVWQIPDEDLNTFGGTSILKTEQRRAADRNSASRGILLSAGFRALDHLAANGMGLGHICGLLRLAPWQMTCGFVKSVKQSVLVLRDGDIVGSEDLAEELMERPAAVELSDSQHFYRDRDGRLWRPTVPGIPEDY